MEMKTHPRPTSPLHAVAWACIATGTILMLAMAFGQLRQDLALFLGTSAYVIGGLLWGFADDAAATAPRASGPAVRIDGREQR